MTSDVIHGIMQEQKMEQEIHGYDMDYEGQKKHKTNSFKYELILTKIIKGTSIC